YAARYSLKVSASAFLMLGTIRARVPSGLGRSIAIPRFTWAGTTTEGLPSTSAYETFWLGNSFSVWIRAQPMRCVKLILPPRERDMWLLMTMRLSISSFGGIVRTLVAVGIVRDLSILAASVFERPPSGVTVS